METADQKRILGKSTLSVTPIGLGCWQFSKQNNMAGKFWPKLFDDRIINIVAGSLEGGINWFDTAEVYGSGASERALAAALKAARKKPGEILIATKWWPMLRSAGNIRKTIQARLDALAPYPIDLYQVHQPFGFSGERKEMQAMAEQVKAGNIRYVGISNFSEDKMRNAWDELQKAGLPLVSNQVRYSLLNRKIESNGILKAARELGITIIAYSPLAQGILSGKFHDHPELLKNIGLRKYSGPFKPYGLAKSLPLVRLLQEMAEKYSVTPSQIALNWLIYFHGESVVAIPGATKESHIEENTGAMKFRMTDDDMDRIDQASRIFL